jgi:hypothetical protein
MCLLPLPFSAPAQLYDSSAFMLRPRRRSLVCTVVSWLCLAVCGRVWPPRSRTAECRVQCRHRTHAPRIAHSRMDDVHHPPIPAPAPAPCMLLTHRSSQQGSLHACTGTVDLRVLIAWPILYHTLRAPDGGHRGSGPTTGYGCGQTRAARNAPSLAGSRAGCRDASAGLAGPGRA